MLIFSTRKNTYIHIVERKKSVKKKEKTLFTITPTMTPPCLTASRDKKCRCVCALTVFCLPLEVQKYADSRRRKSLGFLTDNLSMVSTAPPSVPLSAGINTSPQCSHSQDEWLEVDRQFINI